MTPLRVAYVCGMLNISVRLSGPRMPDGAYYDSHPQHQQQHQSAYEDGGTERSSGVC